MRYLAIIFSAILLGGCARTTTCVTRSWVKTGTPPVVHDNILVVAMVGSGKSYVEKTIERNVVADIQSKGYHAIAYYDKYGAAEKSKADGGAFIADLRENGETSILAITLLDTTMRTRFVPSDASYETLDQMNTRFTGYFEAPYWPSYARRYEPGVYNTDINYYWRADLYTASSAGVAYSAFITARDPGNTDKLARQYSYAVVKDMEDKALLLRPKIAKMGNTSKTSVTYTAAR